MRLAGVRFTPQPWINVISNDAFGSPYLRRRRGLQLSRNSRDYQLTLRSNDSVTNRPGEASYVHDLDSGASFSPLAAVRGPACFTTCHGQGFTTFRARRGALEMELPTLSTL